MSGITPIRSHGPSFTTLVGTLTHGEDPAQVDGAPQNRSLSTFSRQEIQHGNVSRTGQQVDASSPTLKQATFRVSSNNFLGAHWRIVLGDRSLYMGIDWVPGLTATLTATNIATAIASLGGPWGADNDGGSSDVITVTYADTMNKVAFYIDGVGIANFDSISPDNGFMTTGSPFVGAPTLG